MEKTAVMKTKFYQTNGKRFYNLNGITSLAVGNPYLKALIPYKEKKGEKVEKYFLKEKKNLKKLESEAFLQSSRLSIYNQILSKTLNIGD